MTQGRSIPRKTNIVHPQNGKTRERNLIAVILTTSVLQEIVEIINSVVIQGRNVVYQMKIAVVLNIALMTTVLQRNPMEQAAQKIKNVLQEIALMIFAVQVGKVVARRILTVEVQSTAVVPIIVLTRRTRGTLVL
jgi:hypothetical protein